MKKHCLTLILVTIAVAINAATIDVTPGSNTLRSAVSNAASGDVLQLTTGTYSLTSNIDISTANKVLTIQAATGTSPVLS